MFLLYSLLFFISSKRIKNSRWVLKQFETKTSCFFDFLLTELMLLAKSCWHIYSMELSYVTKDVQHFSKFFKSYSPKVET